MKFFKKKRAGLVALFMTACIILTSCTSQTVEVQQVERTELKFSEIEYKRPDADGLLQIMEDGIEKSQKAFLPFGLLDKLGEVNEMVGEYYTMYGVAQIRNYLDVTDEYYSSEMEYLNGKQAEISNRYNDFVDAMLDSKAGSILTWIWGEESVAEQQLLAETTSNDIVDLLNEEQKLCSDYYYQYSQATVEMDGQEVLYSSLDPDTRSMMSSYFLEKYNKILGDIFIQLVENRKKQAEQLGFENFVELTDQKMQRTYSRKQMKSFREKLKRTLVPVYNDVVEDMYGRLEQKLQNPESDISLFLLDDMDEPIPEGTWEDTMETFLDVYSSMSSETSECFNYMNDHEFINAEPSQNKANIIFSTSLGDLNTPFLFANLDGTAQDVFQISHEFGHCTAIFLQQDMGSEMESKFMDVSEIHSQAMQFLTLPYYEKFFGDEAETARKHTLLNIMSVILSSAMDDEFQEIIYMTPDITLEEVNELYGKLLLEYGLVSTSIYADLSTSRLQWFTTNQNFDTPFYSIDYALSGCVALEFLQRSMEDYGAALEDYFFLVRQNYDDDFETVVANAHMTNPMDEEQLVKLAELCQTLLEEGGFVSLAEAEASTAVPDEEPVPLEDVEETEETEEAPSEEAEAA